MEGTGHRVMNVIELRFTDCGSKSNISLTALLFLDDRCHSLAPMLFCVLSVNVHMIMPLFAFFRMVNRKTLALSIPG